MKKFLISVVIYLIISAIVIKVDAQQTSTNFDWIKHARIFIIDGYTYPLFPKLEFDAEKIAVTMADMHGNVLRIATSGYCDWLIPGTQFKTAKDLGNRDILAECIKACKPRGIKVVPYLRTGGPIRTEIMNPEWAHIVNPAGDTRSYWDLGAKATALCWNTPYREAFYDYVKIITSKYDIDGIYFDSWLAFYAFSGQACYCKGCKKGFKDFSGKDIPYRENPSRYTPEELKTIAQYRDWYSDELFKIFTETKRIIKFYKDIPLIYNINNPSRISTGNFGIIKGSDAFLYERGKSMIERAEGVSLATAHGINVWPYVGTYDPFPRISHFKYELQQEAFTSFAFGGSPVLYHTFFFVNHPESREPIKEAFSLIDNNPDYFKGFRSAEFCAVVWNDTDPPGHATNAFLWNTNARINSLGTFRACLNNYIQTTSLLKQDLDNIELLNKYKVLCLPDICYLTELQVKNITSFVENGGGLIMIYSTSLFDEKGNKRTDFTLGALAKISFHKPDEILQEKIMKHYTYGGVWDMYLKTRHGQNVIKSPLADGLIPTHVYETVSVLPGGTIVADQVSGTNNETIAPGLIVSRYGKGKVAYISAAVGAMYEQTGIREYADFLKNCIEYVSRDKIPYNISTPYAALITNMTVNGDQIILHLINWTGSNHERILQNVYYIPPVENVAIEFTIPDGKDVKNISTIIPANFSQKQEKNILTIKIPKIENYQAVRMEIK